MLVYQSLDAVIAHQKPETCRECYSSIWLSRSAHVDSPPVGYGHELRVIWWRCALCSDETERWLYLNRREALWTVQQVQLFRQARREADMSLKDVSTLAHISVSRLSDFERRHAAPSEDEMHALKSVFTLW